MKGPIPWRWIERAAALGGKALAIGMALWREAGYRETAIVNVTLRRLAVGSSEDATRRAVKSLEAAGLVRVERPPGRALRITLLEAYP